jgi:hypothetical protein
LLKKELVILSIILVLAGLTHVFNVAGFPIFHTDESNIMRRILVVLNGIGLQEKTGFYKDAYDHPFFGQILIGTLLHLTGYPNFITSHTIASIQLAIAVPRMIMGIFAIIDTFLVFKISHRAFNTPTAIFASLLFAVSPMTWQLRLITLDNIGLPFLLTSIFIALSMQEWNKKRDINKHILLVLIAGTSLGLAILTKVPFFVMIPLVGYLICKNSNYVQDGFRLRMLLVWLIPIILIPSVWPLYALSVGEIDLWEKGLLHQVHREDRRAQIIESFFDTDSMLLILGLAGLIYSCLRKNWIVILWIVPFLVFVYVHGWFISFHWVIALPAFCIGGAALVIELVQRMKFVRIKKSTTQIIICTIITGIGLFNTFTIINLNIESDSIRGIAESLYYIDKADGLEDNRMDEKVTVITRPAYSWIYKYVYGLNYTIDTAYDIGLQKIQTNKTIIYQDSRIADILHKLEKKFSSFVLDIGKTRKICNLYIEWYDTGQAHSPVLVMTSKSRDSKNTRYDSDYSTITTNSQGFDLKNTRARYIYITIPRNTDSGYDDIAKISIHAKEKSNDEYECKAMPIKNINFNDNKLLFNISPHDLKRMDYRLNDYKSIASYEKLFNGDIKKISEYKTEKSELTVFTKLFSPMKYWPPRNLQLLANY